MPAFTNIESITWVTRQHLKLMCLFRDSFLFSFLFALETKSTYLGNARRNDAVTVHNADVVVEAVVNEMTLPHVRADCTDGDFVNIPMKGERALSTLTMVRARKYNFG